MRGAAGTDEDGAGSPPAGVRADPVPSLETTRDSDVANQTADTTDLKHEMRRVLENTTLDGTSCSWLSKISCCFSAFCHCSV